MAAVWFLALGRVMFAGAQQNDSLLDLLVKYYYALRKYERRGVILVSFLRRRLVAFPSTSLPVSLEELPSTRPCEAALQASAAFEMPAGVSLLE